MTESVRPSAGEEARAAARAAELKKTKQTQQAAGQQGAQAAGLGQDKKLKTSFDELLKNAASEQGAANLLPPENKFDSRLKEIHHEDDRHSDRDKDDDRKPSDKAESGKKTKEPASGVKERVLGKHGSGDQQGGSGSDSGGKREGGSQRGFQKDSASAQAFSADLKRRDPAPAPVPMQVPGLQATAPVAAPESPAAPRELPKALLDQIVQSVTIIQKGDLQKEIQIDFHDKIFHGLKLKVTSQGQEVSVEFLVPNRTVEETFKQERENIALALGEKGVDVRAINVTRM
ncbi:MAG: hypothetical protein IT573_07490 [Deltaproteobacteria bacterium]|nr:hypothetical protein [Deltaproteobacteria bacterium]